MKTTVYYNDKTGEIIGVSEYSPFMASGFQMPNAKKIELENPDLRNKRVNIYTRELEEKT